MFVCMSVGMCKTVCSQNGHICILSAIRLLDNQYHVATENLVGVIGDSQIWHKFWRHCIGVIVESANWRQF